MDTRLGDVDGQAQCEQVRLVAKARLKERAGELSRGELAKIRLVLRQLLVE